MAYITDEFLWKEFNNNPEDEEEVGAVPIETPMSVCSVKKSVNNDYVFSEEIPATISWRRREIRPFNPFWRLEVKIDQQNPAVTPQFDLIVSQLPYSNKWVHSTRFKDPSKHRKQGEIPGTIRDLDQLLQFLDADAQWDYFQKGKYLTAGISKPFSDSADSKTRNVQKNATYLFGVCENLSDVKNDIYNSEYIQNLLYLTEINKIRFTPVFISKRFTSHPKLKDDVIEKRNVLMATAIIQALSGPVDSEKYLGKSVLGLVELCYKQLLHYENRKKKHDKSTIITETPSGTSIFDTLPSDETNPEEKTIENRVKDKIQKVLGMLSTEVSSIIRKLFGIGCEQYSEESIITNEGLTEKSFNLLKKNAFAKLQAAILEDPDLREFLEFI